MQLYSHDCNRPNEQHAPNIARNQFLEAFILPNPWADV